jgi:hypothetical protein
MSQALLTSDFLLQQQEAQVGKQQELFKKHYDGDKRCCIDLRWYGHPIHSNPAIDVDILVSSRKLKGDVTSPPDMLFRTHLYEFRIVPSAEFLEWMNAAGYFVELRLYKKHHAGHKVQLSDDEDNTNDQEEIEDSKSSEYTMTGRPVITYTFTEDIEKHSWLINLNWPEEKNRISFRGDFYFRISAYRRTDEDVYRRLFSKISSSFRILSKPGVFLQQNKKRKALEEEDEDQPNRKRPRGASIGFEHAPPDPDLVPKPPSGSPPVLPPPTIQPSVQRTLNPVFAPPGMTFFGGPQMPTFGMQPTTLQPMVIPPTAPEPIEYVDDPMKVENVEEPKKPKKPSPKKKTDAKKKNVFFDEPKGSSPSDLSQPVTEEFVLDTQIGMSQDGFITNSQANAAMNEIGLSTPQTAGNSPFKETPKYKQSAAAAAVINNSGLKMPGSPTTETGVFSPPTGLFQSMQSPYSARLLSLNFSQESQNDSQSRDWDFFASNQAAEGVQFDNMKTPMTVGTVGTPTTILNNRRKVLNTNLLEENGDDNFYDKVCLK